MRQSVTSSAAAHNGLQDKIDAIRAYYRQSLNHVDVRAIADSLAFDKSGRLDISGFFDKLHSLIRYLPDPTGAELIKAPWAMVDEIHERGFASGDCDDLASLAYTLLHMLGVSAKLIVGWYGGPSPTHIYVGVPQKTGGYLPFDLVWPAYGKTKRGAVRTRAYD